MENPIGNRNMSVQQFRVVFPKYLNSNGTFFGGEAMQWLDEVAFITATRYTRQRMVTVKIDQVRFLKPIFPNTIVEITGKISKAGNYKLFITVEVFMEEMYSTRREKAIEADFIFAPCNDELAPVPLKKQEPTP
ncbi:MAG: acyl-CoA thioesterase [Bacteroidales bacterium]